jgi:hypothetical protein
MNPHNIPRFTEGPDLHFAGGEDAPLLFPVRSEDSIDGLVSQESQTARADRASIIGSPQPLSPDILGGVDL